MPRSLMPGPHLPDDKALLLDLDGTLLDIAPTPDGVVVPPDLLSSLHMLRRRLGNALAIVTGRPIAQVDALLGDIPYAVAGEHGAAIRHAPATAEDRVPQPPIPAGWLDRAAAAIAAHPGALLEPKAHSFVLHFRRAPDAEATLRGFADALVRDRPSHIVMQARMAWEIRPRGVDKGSAVAALMARSPFAGRTPVYVGDDVTDEAAIRMAQALGGTGLRVDDAFATPAGVRAWLAREAAR